MREILRLQKKYHSDYLKKEEMQVNYKYSDFISKESINSNHIRIYQEITSFLEALFEKKKNTETGEYISNLEVALKKVKE